MVLDPKPSLVDDTSESSHMSTPHRTDVRTQFTLLDRSLPKARPELLDEITSFKIDASKVALLTSADLASAERLEELEKAKRAALEQTVKQKPDASSVRLGRDGFEQVEDFRERDMGVLARQEQAARKEAARRESLNAETPDSPTVPASPFGDGRDSASATPQLENVQSNTVTQPQSQSPVVKRESVDIRPAKSPIKSNFGLVSAWSGGADDSEHQSLSLGDQSALDLSDIVAEPEVDTVMDIAVKEGIVSEKPVVWTGGVSPPLNFVARKLIPDRQSRCREFKTRQDGSPYCSQNVIHTTMEYFTPT
jgi:hypothetical protein